MNRLGLVHSIIAASLGALAVGCGDACLAYDYAPPSLRLQLRDAASGEPLCSPADFVVTTSRGALSAHEEACEWWLAGWTDAEAEVARAELELQVEGYLPRTFAVDVRRNGCGEIQRPPVQELDVVPE